ncbi:DUF3568 family protein [Nitrospira sp. Kam-Ns4a]
MRRIRTLWLSLTLLLTAPLTGCALLLVGAAGGTAGVVYVNGQLKEELDVPVPTPHQAAVAGLKDLNLPVLEDKGDKLTASVKSDLASDTQVWISIESLTDSRSKITIRVGVMGDEAKSRQILEATKRHL